VDDPEVARAARTGAAPGPRWTVPLTLRHFCCRWGFRPRACAPFRARTKGKTESGVGYVKRNAIAGRAFASWEAFEAHLAAWERDIANARVHGTTGEVPLARFARDEAAALKPLADRPPFRACRTLERCVRLRGGGRRQCLLGPVAADRRAVEVIIAAGQARVRHGVREVAVHALAEGRRQRVIDAAHLAGVAGVGGRAVRARLDPAGDRQPPSALLRPLAEYQALVGGGF
jgi:hypothetical protein